MAQKLALVTGFEPYGGRGINPSAEVAKHLDGTEVAGSQVVGRTLPVSYRSLRRRIDELLSQLEPALVIGLGLWPGEPVIRLERFGLNLADFEIADNEGLFLQEAPLEAEAPTALPARLPLRAIEEALLDAGIPARLSSSAGSFLCNATLYAFLQRVPEGVPCGFIHLPYLPKQVTELLRQIRQERVLELHQRADLASMSLDLMLRAVRIAIEVTLAAKP
jgi:pyroglutamyl-peptidase